MQNLIGHLKWTKGTFNRMALLTFGQLVLLLCLTISPAPVDAQGIVGLLRSQEAPAAETAEPEKAAQRETLEEASVAAEASVEKYGRNALLARDVMREIVGNAPGLGDAIETTLRSKGANGGLYWLSSTLMVVAIAIAVGLAAYSLVLSWGRRQFAHLYEQEVHQRADKVGYLFLRAILMTAGLVVFVCVSGLLLLFLKLGSESGQQTAFVILGVMTLFLFLRIVFLNLLAPYSPSHRLFPMADHHAKGLYRSMLIGIAVSAIVLALCKWMEKLGLPVNAHKLALIGAALLSCLILCGIAIVYRNVLGALIRGRAGEAAPLWRRVISKSWHLVAVVYFLIAWAISSVRILLGLPDATGLVVAPLETLLITLVVYGLLILLIDRVLLPRLDTSSAQAVIADDIRRAENLEGEDLDSEGTEAQARAEAAEREALRSPFRHLLDHGATILVMFGAVALLARLWGAPLANDDSTLGGIVQVLLIAFFGYMAYKAVEVSIDGQIGKQGPGEDKDEEAEVGGAGESRISTLLPILRNFLLISIVAISVMIGLSQIGVNIAPLFAGAGVVGLAIGFGAQTLIRDIFSGAFYLMDDAFRKGEYIDIGSAKGVVEKISIRSMQLRHHRGALTTIPFGEIQHVQNFSRDWAIMKLAFRVTYDTDVEKMRKIIKKFGQLLLDDEYYGPMFLQPLKSQGILSMEDSAMIARVKFMTKPGKQFEVRKVVYVGLQERFEEAGIKFAHKQVTVRVAPQDGDETATPTAAGAAAAASHAVAGAAAAGMIEDEENAEN
ncbi:mechanosensitive ion channel family protein [Roseibium algae]|uniref:Mechanosensitive ion channel domain-containing protein n=1 Tax=Roseibium algae TaxID=3123038 RepID=A0ABU8TKF2_9HYPH